MESFREKRGETFVLEDIRPYGSRDSFEFTRLFREPAQVNPFLTSALPLTPLTPLPNVLYVPQQGLDELLLRRCWRLPNARESEWMTSAGGHLFPWGDQLPKWMWGYEVDNPDLELDDEDLNAMPGDGDSFELHFRFEQDAGQTDWTRANAFGLIDALVASHWVLDEGRLSWHGGAGSCYPWQACGEWAGFITGAIVPESEPMGSGHALRPVVDVDGL